MPQYSQSTTRELWKRSYGLCAFPGCRREEADTENPVQIAHIVAQNKGGPRADPNYPKNKINSYDNLILLCPNHHTIVDSDVLTYTVDGLIRMKTEHESWVLDRMLVSKPWKINISDFYYVNMLRLASFALLNGYQMDIADTDMRAGFSDAGFMQAITALKKAKQLLDGMRAKALSIEDLVYDGENAVGSIVEFDGHFRTKNFPRDLGNFRLAGTIEYDPHIYRVYRNLDGYRLILPYDPIWLTSNTSKVMLSSGSLKCAGLCRIRGVDPVRKELMASPYFIGIPKPAWNFPSTHDIE